MKVPVDVVPAAIFPEKCRDWLKGHFFGLSWYETYNFMEFIVANHKYATKAIHPTNEATLELWANSILERECSGYRFIGQVLTPITEEIELEEVRVAAELQGHGLDGARQHIRAAVALFSKRPDPDYRNAIKEAISGIESITILVSGETKIGSALRKLESKIGLHPAMTRAFEKLYGYTSDEDGIRHAILDESSVGFDEAKYMIVACSAFINFLAGKAEQAGLLK